MRDHQPSPWGPLGVPRGDFNSVLKVFLRKRREHQGTLGRSKVVLLPWTDCSCGAYPQGKVIVVIPVVIIVVIEENDEIATFT